MGGRFKQGFLGEEFSKVGVGEISVLLELGSSPGISGISCSGTGGLW